MAAAPPLTSFDTADDVQAFHQRAINSISDDNSGVRRRALEQLWVGLKGPYPDGTDDAAHNLLRQLFPVVMKPLLKRFSDPVEKCRELAIELVGGHCVIGCNGSVSVPPSGPPLPGAPLFVLL